MSNSTKPTLSKIKPPLQVGHVTCTTPLYSITQSKEGRHVGGAKPPHFAPSALERQLQLKDTHVLSFECLSAGAPCTTSMYTRGTFPSSRILCPV